MASAEEIQDKEEDWQKSEDPVNSLLLQIKQEYDNLDVPHLLPQMINVINSKSETTYRSSPLEEKHTTLLSMLQKSNGNLNLLEQSDNNSSAISFDSPKQPSNEERASMHSSLQRMIMDKRKKTSEYHDTSQQDFIQNKELIETGDNSAESPFSSYKEDRKRKMGHLEDSYPEKKQNIKLEENGNVEKTISNPEAQPNPQVNKSVSNGGQCTTSTHPLLSAVLLSATTTKKSQPFSQSPSFTNSLRIREPESTTQNVGQVDATTLPWASTLMQSIALQKGNIQPQGADTGSASKLLLRLSQSAKNVSPVPSAMEKWRKLLDAKRDPLKVKTPFPSQGKQKKNAAGRRVKKKNAPTPSAKVKSKKVKTVADTDEEDLNSDDFVPSDSGSDCASPHLWPRKKNDNENIGHVLASSPNSSVQRLSRQAKEKAKKVMTLAASEENEDESDDFVPSDNESDHVSSHPGSGETKEKHKGSTLKSLWRQIILPRVIESKRSSYPSQHTVTGVSDQVGINRMSPSMNGSSDNQGTEVNTQPEDWCQFQIKYEPVDDETESPALNQEHSESVGAGPVVGEISQPEYNSNFINGGLLSHPRKSGLVASYAAEDCVNRVSLLSSEQNQIMVSNLEKDNAIHRPIINTNNISEVEVKEETADSTTADMETDNARISAQRESLQPRSSLETVLHGSDTGNRDQHIFNLPSVEISGNYRWSNTLLNADNVTGGQPESLSTNSCSFEKMALLDLYPFECPALKASDVMHIQFYSAKQIQAALEKAHSVPASSKKIMDFMQLRKEYTQLTNKELPICSVHQDLFIQHGVFTCVICMQAQYNKDDFINRTLTNFELDHSRFVVQMSPYKKIISLHANSPICKFCFSLIMNKATIPLIHTDDLLWCTQFL
ncbi:uncharacterized protein LOC106161583 [Lingula anatina]|uniref:Uncharacterized protein LOC106161583 n=1 Tax=Lingula anatina TaxID=7574 RepID=A0A1S3I748_LINAN|nr:uncharacterized protein LOC106161583 [Lingula anatina]|eukprot:XP_013394033.1 uncharacterized protein LOC106161583 [Lingula anatina]